MKKIFNFFKKLFQKKSEKPNELETIALKILEDTANPIGYQITDYDGNSKVYSQRHVFKTFLDAMDFADNNNFLFGFEVRPVFANDIIDPVYIDSSLCR